MKKWTINFALFISMTFLLSLGSSAQTITELAQPLTKQSQKGYIDDVKFEGDGKIHVIYQNKLDKKSTEVAYEDYVFDKGMKFVEKKTTTIDKEIKPDSESKMLGAYVGGGPKCTSFDVLSMKIRTVTFTRKYSDWNYKKQRYETIKDVDQERGKLKTDDNKPYYGIESWWREDNPLLTVLAYNETKDKKNPKKYLLLNIDFDGNVKETPLDVSGSYSLVYSQKISEEQPGKAVGKQDVVVILAPKDGAPNLSEYIYLHYDMSGTLKNKITFQSPSTNLLVTNATVIDGAVFLFGQSTKSKKAFNDVFEDYAAIESPCFKGSGGDAENPQMSKYLKASSEEMDNFHVFKITGGKLDFATTSSVDGIKSKVKSPPSEKGTPYKGKRFSIYKFEVTPSNEYLIAGQLTDRITTKAATSSQVGMRGWSYGDIVCLHLDAKGNLKAQYAVDKIWEGKKSSLWEMPQNFYFAADGKSVYWEIFEIKGDRDYNAWTGWSDYVQSQMYPRITKINLETTTISDFKTFGNRKYFVYQSFPSKFLPEQNCILYFGKNEDESVLWVGKAAFD